MRGILRQSEQFGYHYAAPQAPLGGPVGAPAGQQPGQQPASPPAAPAPASPPSPPGAPAGQNPPAGQQPGQPPAGAPAAPAGQQPSSPATGGIPAGWILPPSAMAINNMLQGQGRGLPQSMSSGSQAGPNGAPAGAPSDPNFHPSAAGPAGGPGQPGVPDAQGILPNARPLYDQLMKRFPGSNIGGYRVDDYHEHDHGAMDFMTNDPNQAHQVMQMAFDAGAPYVLYQQRQWNRDGTSSAMDDRHSPTANHMDHVHIAPFTPAQLPPSARTSARAAVARYAHQYGIATPRSWEEAIAAQVAREGWY